MNGKRWRFVGTWPDGSGAKLLAEAAPDLGESHARVLGHLLADDTKMSVAAHTPGGSTLGNPGTPPDYRVLTVKGRRPIAELYIERAIARRLATRCAELLGVPVLLVDVRKGMPKLSRTRLVQNPDPDPVRGEIWRGRISGSRVRVGSASGERVIFTDLDTGNREYADVREFKARYKGPQPRTNPPADRPGNDRNFTIHTIRTALAKRSGRPWSVTAGRGTAWGWIKVKAPPGRSTWSHRLKPGMPDWPENYEPYDTRQGGHGMSPTDRQDLADLMGLTLAEVGTDGISIPASFDYYEEYMDRAQGRTPERLGTPYWDNPRGSKKERADSLKVGDLVMPPDRELRLWMRRTAAKKGMSEDELGIMLTDIHEGTPDKKGRWLWFTGYLRDKWYAGGKQFPFKFKARPDTLWAVVAHPTPNPGRVFGQPVPTSGISSQIRSGDRVTYVDRFGVQHTGRAVMPSSHGGWVLNMGGRYGTPAVVDDSNIVKVTRPKVRTTNPRRKRRTWLDEYADYDLRGPGSLEQKAATFMRRVADFPVVGSLRKKLDAEAPKAWARAVSRHEFGAACEGRRPNPKGRKLSPGESVIYSGRAWWYEREDSMNTLTKGNEEMRYNEPANVVRSGPFGRYLVRSVRDGRLAWADGAHLELPLANPRGAYRPGTYTEAQWSTPSMRAFIREQLGYNINESDVETYARYLNKTMRIRPLSRARQIVWAAVEEGDAAGTPPLRNPSYRIQGTIEELPEVVARRRPGRPRKAVALEPSPAPEIPPAELEPETTTPTPEIPPAELEPRRGFVPGEIVSVPYSGRGSYFGRKTRRTHEHGTVEGYERRGDELMVHVRVRRGHSTEDHYFPERHVRRLPRSHRAVLSSRLPQLKARLERKVGGDLAKAEAMIQKAVAEYEENDTLAHEIYPQAGTRPSREYTNARAKMRRLQERLDALRSIVHDLGGPSRLGEAPFEVAFNPSRSRAARSARQIRRMPTVKPRRLYRAQAAGRRDKAGRFLGDMIRRGMAHTASPGELAYRNPGEDELWATFDRFEFQMPIEAVQDLTGPGNKDQQADYWASRIPRPAGVSPKLLASELKEYGAWDNDQLGDDAENWRRILWIGAGNIESSMEERDNPGQLDPDGTVHMTRAEYAKVPRDYRGRYSGAPFSPASVKGKPNILTLDPETGATILVPVTITDARRRNPLPRWADPRSIRTVKSGGARILVGCPVGHYHPRAKGRKCDVGMRAIEVRNPRDGELERGAQTFQMWHEFPHHKITKVKVPFTRWPRHLVKLGEVVRIDYVSNKWEGKNRTYTHATRRPRPILVTDPDAKTVNLVGGAMRPTADGLVN